MYQPRAPFLPFHMRRQRWACLVAHRRAGKTVACVNELLTRALATKKTKAQYAYIGPFRGQVKKIAWKYLKDYGRSVIVYINETELYVELFNGSQIFLSGADNPDNLRGLYLDGVILDEYADMRPSIWGAVIRPMLADRRGWAVFIGTPKGHNGFYEIYKQALADPESWFCLTLRASESGLLSADELADARKQMTEDQYAQEFECSFEAAITGAVYGRWMFKALTEGRIRRVPPLPGIKVNTAWDLGYDDATAIWWWQASIGEIRVLDYYENSGEAIPHYCQVVKDREHDYGTHYVPHDAANELLAAGGRSIVQQAYALGVKMTVVAATSQQNAIEATRKTIESCWFDEERCGPGLECLRQYQFEWDEDKKVYKSKPRHDWASHGADAFEIIGQVWRRPSLPAEPEKPRFLNEMTADELFWPTTNSAPRERI